MAQETPEVQPPSESLLEKLRAPVKLQYPVQREKGLGRKKHTQEVREVEFGGFGADLYYYAVSLPGGTEAFQKKLGEKPSGEARLTTTAEHCYPSLPEDLRFAVTTKAKEILQQAGIDLGDKRVSLFKFFELKGPEIIAEVSQVEETELQIPPGKKLVEEETLQDLAQTAINSGKEAIQLRQRLAKAEADLEAAQRENIKLAQAPEDVQKLAAFIRSGGQAGKIEALMATTQLPDAIAIANLLKTVHDKLGEEELKALLTSAAETLKAVQFIAVGEMVTLRGESYKIIRSLGGGDFGQVFLTKVTTGHRKDQLEAWKVSKDQRYLEKEYMAMRNVGNAQQAANLPDNQYTPQYISAGDQREGFAVPFFNMEYVPGQTLDQVIGNIRAEAEAQPLTEDAVREIFRQVSHLGHLIEKAGLEQKEVYPVTLAADFKIGRIKVVDPQSWKIKVIDWSLPFPPEKESLPQVKREALTIIGKGMTSLLGKKEASPEMQAIIWKCTGQNPEEFPPYQSFTELYRDLSS